MTYLRVFALCALGVAAWAQEDASRQFAYRGKPVHPLCIFFPVDSARTEPQDLAECTNEKVEPKSEPGGWLKAEYEDGLSIWPVSASYRPEWFAESPPLARPSLRL